MLEWMQGKRKTKTHLNELIVLSRELGIVILSISIV